MNDGTGTQCLGVKAAVSQTSPSITLADCLGHDRWRHGLEWVQGLGLGRVGVRAWAGAAGAGALVALTQKGRPAYTLSRPESRQGSGPPGASMSGSTARATQRVNSCAAGQTVSGLLSAWRVRANCKPPMSGTLKLQLQGKARLKLSST